MPLVTDKLLLRMEPSVFLDAQAAGLDIFQLSNGELTSPPLFTSTNGRFITVGTTEDHVFVIGNEPLEIQILIADHAVALSRRRVEDSEYAINPLTTGTGLSYVIRTFTPLAKEAEAWLERMLGLYENHPTLALTSENVLNYTDFAPLLTCRVLANAFALAYANAPEDDTLKKRSDEYRRRQNELQQQMVAFIDLNGDGIAEEQRHFNAGKWVRT